MKLLESIPENPEMRKYVDRYQFFVIDEPSLFHAIPNGKIDMYSILDGGFEILDSRTRKYYTVPRFGFLPATNHITHFRVKKFLVCLNIKLSLRALALPSFKNFNRDYCNKSFVDYLKGYTPTLSKEYHYWLEGGEINVSRLEQYMAPLFSSKKENQQIQTILLQIDQLKAFAVGELADSLHLSTKTLERIIKRNFYLTPRELLGVLRFERTTAHLKSNEMHRFQDALSLGYYDQSHFIKDCRKITGTTPRELLARMKLPTNDLFF